MAACIALVAVAGAAARNRDLHRTPACSAAQLRVKQLRGDPGAAALGTADWYAAVSLHNRRQACLLRIPVSLEVSNASGRSRRVRLTNRRPMTLRMPQGASWYLIFGAWWPLAFWKSDHDGRAFACSRPLQNVIAAKLPVRHGRVTIETRRVLPRVCGSPGSSDLEVVKVRSLI